MPVGWNCTNSMSCSGRPARSTMALPSPVQVWARGAGEVGAAVAAGRQHHQLGVEPVDRAVVQVPGHDAAADAVLVHDQVEREVLDEKLGLVLQRLLIERVQHGVAGTVGGGAGAIGGGLRRTCGSCRRRRAGRSCPPPCARTARHSARAPGPAGIASRHMYSIASWSPSQSDPLTVSYMCQRQSSSPMLPRPHRCRPAPRPCGCGWGTPW